MNNINKLINNIHKETDDEEYTNDIETFHKILQQNEFLVLNKETDSHNYGILGLKLKKNVLKLWRKYFLDKNTVEIYNLAFKSIRHTACT